MATAPRGTSTSAASGTPRAICRWSITVIDTPEKIAAAAEAVEAMMQDGMIVLSDVEAVRLT